ncbi:RDD family protein [uncultured Paraglaciecola sp.]|uniref:RDD family protein n=1 Tax=uncultured Paraglaciecola sp. TaxID=1765024 RepID=UPI0030D8F76A|tara:strand:+ start:54031 stop:55182 length:1152 start_codon:yes stop_codon:yes gene_type:complete
MEKQSAQQLTDVAESESPDSAVENPQLTPKETRQIVTPYAFFVADELLGTPLAGPFRRGFGILIDLIFVSLLTQVSSLILATIAAWTFFKAGNRLETKKRFNVLRIVLRMMVALLLFFVAMGIIDWMDNKNAEQQVKESVSSENAVEGIELIALTAKYLIDTKDVKQQIAQGDCAPAYDCLQRLGEDLMQDMSNTGLEKETIDGILEGYLEAVSDSLSAQQQTQLTSHLQQFVVTKQASTNSQIQEAEASVALPVGEQKTDKDKTTAESTGLISKLVNWVEELGLGLGWAAFYFSIFTAWWKGQTPGKKLLGMKVIKLDNQPLNLWESFGRYGGYAAGLATGLTGFLQVFWDPNRQAIQDKISETLVIDIRKPKVAFVKEMVK